MIRSIKVLGLAWTLLAWSSLPAQESDLPQLDEKNATHLSVLINLSAQETLSPADKHRIGSALDSGDSAVKALALALAYKYEPENRESLFAGMRETFHYRLPPETRIVPLSDFSAILKRIESLNPRLNAQGTTLLAYLYFKEHHLQFLPPDRQPVSAATILRATFLSSLYRDSDVDTRALVKRFYEYQSE